MIFNKIILIIVSILSLINDEKDCKIYEKLKRSYNNGKRDS